MCSHINKPMEHEIIDSWFKGFKAKVTKMDTAQAGEVTILDWAKPNSGQRAIRYVLIGNKVMVTGDLGEAVFCLTEKATVANVASYNFTYFFEKMACTSVGERKSGLDFSSEFAKKFINDALDEDWATFVDGAEKFRDKLLAIADKVSSIDEWRHELAEIESELDFYTPDWWEWLPGAGNTYSPCLMAFLIGIKLAKNQIEERRKEDSTDETI